MFSRFEIRGPLELMVFFSFCVLPVCGTFWSLEPGKGRDEVDKVPERSLRNNASGCVLLSETDAAVAGDIRVCSNCLAEKRVSGGCSCVWCGIGLNP